MADIKIYGISIIVIKFLVWTLLFCGLAFIVSFNPFNLSIFYTNGLIYTILVTIYIFAATFSWYLRKELTDLNSTYIIISTLALISTTLLFYEDKILFYEINHWVCLILWTALCLLYIPESIKGTNKLLYVLSYTWFASGLFLTIGQWPFFEYSNVPLKSLTSIHAVLDLRKLLIGILILFAFIYAAVKVRNEKNLTVKEIFTLENIDDGSITYLQRLLRIGAVIFNHLWQSFMVPLKFLFLVGWETLLYFADIFIGSKSLVSFIFIFLSSLLGLFLCIHLSDYIRLYLIESSWTASIQVLGYISVLISLIILSQIIINFFESVFLIDNKFRSDYEGLKNNFKSKLNESPYLIFAFTCTGVFLFIIARGVPLYELRGFYNSGVFTALMISIILVGAIYSFFTKRKNEKSVDITNNNLNSIIVEPPIKTIIIEKNVGSESLKKRKRIRLFKKLID